MTQWNASWQTANFRRWRRFPDPVGVVNARSWRALDENMIDRFQARYRRFLDSFDGFVVAFPPSFVELYQGLDRPVLVDIAIRYETPYTGNPQAWQRLDRTLTAGVETGKFHIAANNQGDRDYLAFHTGIEACYVPSVGDYTGMQWQGGKGPTVLLSRAPEIDERILDATNGSVLPAEERFGVSYTWSDLETCQAVVVVPYATSTMTLFELATAGVPVIVPDRALLRRWMKLSPGVLSDLSFFTKEGLDTSALPPGSPNRVGEQSTIEWWLDRADFYESWLMPNVLTVSSEDEIPDAIARAGTMSSSNYGELIRHRNNELNARRRALVRGFANLLH